jgi:outer membrane lipoprotein-sorting protein
LATSSTKIKEIIMRIFWGIASLLIVASSLQAQSADEIIAKYLKTVGGIDKIQAVNTLIRTGKFTGGGGFEAEVRQENKRPNLVREEFSIQGMTGITAYDGKTGWKIEPWGGRRDPEALGEEEMKGILEDTDFDGPLVNYKQKGYTVKYLGTDPVDGTDAYKLEVALTRDDTWTFYMDMDYCVPIKIEIKRMVRGEAREYELALGDYKEVNGWFMPFFVEAKGKGDPSGSKTTYEKIEANVPVDDSRFHQPAAGISGQPGK